MVNFELTAANQTTPKPARNSQTSLFFVAISGDKQKPIEQQTNDHPKTPLPTHQTTGTPPGNERPNDSFFPANSDKKPDSKPPNFTTNGSTTASKPPPAHHHFLSPLPHSGKPSRNPLFIILTLSSKLQSLRRTINF
ncbi:hypothetical protein MTR67_044742 [Solanum verrucosum]|uniref:Uncharacterized protein n=1 Tax=Solanum verrucosum TaxID=315347 RepID=A0AAF0US31_SOLVR|nr:hypothetical protein MTR67_044742 [Solanum verrucosum]